MMKSKKLWENKVGLGLSKKGGIPAYSGEVERSFRLKLNA